MAPLITSLSTSRDHAARPPLADGGAVVAARPHPVATTERGRQMLQMLNSLFDAWQRPATRVSNPD